MAPRPHWSRSSSREPPANQRQGPPTRPGILTPFFPLLRSTHTTLHHTNNSVGPFRRYKISEPPTRDTEGVIRTKDMIRVSFLRLFSALARDVTARAVAAATTATAHSSTGHTPATGSHYNHTLPCWLIGTPFCLTPANRCTLIPENYETTHITSEA